MKKVLGLSASQVSLPKGANGGAIPKKKSFAGALSGANKGVETPPKGNSGRYECLTESPVQMTPRKSTAKRRLSDGRPQVLRPVDQADRSQVVAANDLGKSCRSRARFRGLTSEETKDGISSAEDA